MNKELLKLLQEYPEAEIIPCTFWEVVGEDWGYWIGDIDSVYYGKIWIYDERFYFNFEDLKEQIEETDGLEYEDVKDTIIIREGIIIKIGME